MIRLSILLISSLMILLSSGARAAYLEPTDSGSIQRSDPTPERIAPLPPVPPPPPRPWPPRGSHVKDVLDRALQGLSLGWPESRQELTLYPLNRRPLPLPSMINLREAMGWGGLEIRETGDVSDLWASNHGSQRVFLMAGQIVTGGRQNRTLSLDVMMSPWRENVRLPVYCIQKGRWEGNDVLFAPGSKSCPQGVRKEALQQSSQERVWAEVDAVSERLGESSESQDLDEVLRSENIERRTQETMDHFRPILGSPCVGFVACYRDRVMGMELFGRPELFAGLRDELLMSYVSEVCDGPGRWWQRGGRSVARQFLADLSRADARLCSTPGDGEGIEVHGPGIEGRGVALEGNLVHLSVW